MIRTVAIYVAAALYTISLLWLGAQLSPTVDDVVRIVERSDR